MTDISRDSEQDRVLAEWSKFTRGHEGIQHIRPITLEAWQRCRELGIVPDQLTYTFLSNDQLEQLQQQNADLIEAAEPYMEYLSLGLDGTPHVVALSDREGWIIAIRGTPETFGGTKTGISLGSSWAEQTIGNNGIGTALSAGEPVLIYGVEHYAEAYHPATCLGVPIHRDGEICGALDISVLNRDADPIRLTLAQACVASIERTLAANGSYNGQRSDSDEQIVAMENILASTVHDLKHPLTAMRGISQLGARTASDEQTRKYFEMVQSQVDRLTAMVEDILQMDPRSKVIANPGPIIEEIFEEIALVCEEKGIRTQVTIENTNVAMLDLELFRRAIQNIVMNAVEAMQHGGTLEARAVDHGETIHITVSDTGPGIPPEIHSELFQPFVSARDGGTGLGLALANHAVVNVHSGRLWFSTGQGQGTTFFIEIPASDASDADRRV